MGLGPDARNILAVPCGSCTWVRPAGLGRRGSVCIPPPPTWPRPMKENWEARAESEALGPLLSCVLTTLHGSERGPKAKDLELLMAHRSSPACFQKPGSPGKSKRGAELLLDLQSPTPMLSFYGETSWLCLWRDPRLAPAPAVWLSPLPGSSSLRVGQMSDSSPPHPAAGGDPEWDL